MNIDKVWHFSRYSQLLSLASLTRLVRSCSEQYRAALYILAGSKELFEVSKHHVTEDEIEFENIMTEARKQELGQSIYVAIDTAYCLYHTPEERPIDWYSFAALDENMLRIVLDALNIRKVRGLFPTCNEHGEMVLKLCL